MSKETTEVSAEGRGVTIKELRNFLVNLPTEFDDFEMVNGEVAHIDEQIYARLDKPIVTMSIDKNNKEFVLLHQTEAEVDEIMKNVAISEPTTTEENGDTKGT